VRFRRGSTVLEVESTTRSESQCGVRLNGLRSESERLREGFDLRIWEEEENGRGKIVAVQLRGELPVGGELRSHRIRASSRASRRRPRRPGHSPQTVLLRSLSLPSRSHLSPQHSPRSFFTLFNFL